MKEKLSTLEEELQNLDAETQKEKVNEFLKGLSEEELLQLKQNQCLFCMISQGKIQSKKIYESSNFLGILDIKPANPGHVLLFSKKHIQYLSDLKEEEISEVFNIANKIGINLIKKFGAKGFNIFLASGNAAGQRLDHFCVHIIPRFENDGINFDWKPKNSEDKILEEIKNLIKIEEKSKKIEEKIIKKSTKEIKRIP